MEFSFLLCCRRFLQCILVGVNVLVGLFGAGVLILGVVTRVGDSMYFDISNDQTDRGILMISSLLIALGSFVVVVAGVGAIGAVFASMLCGRVLLCMYAAVLSFLVVCELAAGITASMKRKEVEGAFQHAINDTFMHTSVDDIVYISWNNFQEKFGCCGVSSYADWAESLNSTVPTSCCRAQGSSACRNATTEPAKYSGALWSRGCSDVVVTWLKSSLGGIAGVATLFALMQIAGVVVSCFVAVYKSTENKYQVV
eukprot:Em0007g937a